MEAKSTEERWKRISATQKRQGNIKASRLTLVSAHGTVSPRSSLLPLFLGHAAHPPLLSSRAAAVGLVLLGDGIGIGMQRRRGTGTRCHLSLLRVIVVDVVQIDVVGAPEVLALRRKLGGVEIVVDVWVGQFGVGAPIVWAGAVLGEGLVEAGLGD